MPAGEGLISTGKKATKTWSFKPLYPALESIMGPIRATRAYPEAILPTLADIYDKVSGELQKNGYDCECLGGGRISHQSQDRKIHVYGYSMVSSGPPQCSGPPSP